MDTALVYMVNKVNVVLFRKIITPVKKGVSESGVFRLEVYKAEKNVHHVHTFTPSVPIRFCGVNIGKRTFTPTFTLIVSPCYGRRYSEAGRVSQKKEVYVMAIKSRHILLTASKIRSYKSCPRLYELQYIYQLKPVKTPEALEVGTNFHAELERLFKGEPFEGEGLPRIMAEAFAKYSPWREWGIVEVELEFSVKVTPFLTLAGKIDAVGGDGTLMEFKTTSSSVGEDTLSGLKFAAGFNWSDQITTYCLAAGVRKVRVAAIQKPSIRQRQGESEEEYLGRCGEWYDEDKIRAFDVYRTDGQVEALEAEVRMLASEIRRRKHFYRNPGHCALMGCPFESICLRQDLGDLDGLVGFVRKEKENEELIGA